MNFPAEYGNELINAIVLATLMFFLLIGFIIIYIRIFKRNKKRHKIQIESSKKEFERQLLQSQVEVQENTYSLLSKELHDNVGQLLSTAKMLLGVTERKLVNPPDTLIKANETIGKAITEIRTISRALDKDWLEQFSFRENLIVEISRINAGGSITATLQDIPLELKAESQVILFRIVQESLQNAIKHAKPKHIDVLIREANNELTITVENDGEQFSEEDHHSAGMGLTNMKQRTALLGGKIAWIKKEAGTQLNISLPLLKNNI